MPAVPVVGIVGFLLCQIGLSFIAYRLGMPFVGSALAVAVALPCAVLLARDVDEPALDGRVVLAFLLAGLVVVFWIFRAGFILPSHDPIAVPVLAKVMVSGRLSFDAFPPGSSAYAYPPGEPLLLAPFVAALGPIDALLVLKVVTLSAVAFIPASWAYLHLRFFPSGARPAWVYLAYYAAFLGIERTLLFAVPFAGKNALLLGLLLLPLVAVACVAASRRMVLWPVGALALFGLVLINYSLLHAAAALLGTLAILLFFTHRLSLARLVGVAAMGLGAASLMVVFLREAISDPRAGGFVFAPLRGLEMLWTVFFSERSAMVIYNDTDFGVAWFHDRGAFLLACFVVAVVIGARRDSADLRWAAVTLLGAIVAILLFSVDVIPAGITFDYGRWILWPVEAALMATALVSLTRLSFRENRIVRMAGYGAFAVTCIVAADRAARDAAVYVRTTAPQVLSRAQLQALAALAPYPDRCFLVAPSYSIPSRLVTVQQNVLLDYAEVVTPCRYANGSWVQPGVEDGRADDGLPSDAALARLTDGAATYFLGTPEQAETYRARHRNFAFRDIGRLLGTYGIWRVEPLSADGPA